ncbi:MAG: type II toxin-antitoxin system VapC family toxin [Acidobacteria bacterium]|nr:type II toxin-antitoxin system VapC family toxin [Acidobacteriota bacterium]
MNLLLDTQIWLRMHREPWKLSSAVTQAVTEPRNELWLSPVSVWELILLVEGRRITLAEPVDAFVSKSRKELSLREAAFTWSVADELRYTILSHRDPADRFLVATAKFYDLTLVTSDRRLLEPLQGLKVMANES